MQSRVRNFYTDGFGTFTRTGHVKLDYYYDDWRQTMLSEFNLVTNTKNRTVQFDQGFFAGMVNAADGSNPRKFHDADGVSPCYKAGYAQGQIAYRMLGFVTIERWDTQVDFLLGRAENLPSLEDVSVFARATVASRIRRAHGQSFHATLEQSREAIQDSQRLIDRCNEILKPDSDAREVQHVDKGASG